jgi:hypothetical protein
MRYKWYSEKVRPLENRPWTLSERALIWRLKAEDPSTTYSDIASHFPDLKSKPDTRVRNMIHNQIRIINKSFNNKCFQCGHELTDQDRQTLKPGRILFLCQKCKKKTTAYKSHLRKVALKHKRCGVCHVNDMIPGKTSCKECLSATQRRRYNKHLCGQCGKNPLDPNSMSFCTECLRINRLNTGIHRMQKQKQELQLV